MIKTRSAPGESEPTQLSCACEICSHRPSHHAKLFLLKSSLSVREIDTKIPAIIILLALLSVAPIRIGNGLIGDLNPHETGAIVMESYFNPNWAVYDNY